MVEALSKRLEALEKNLAGEVLDSILDLFAANVAQYIPQIGQIQQELKQFQKRIDGEMDVIRDSLLSAPSLPSAGGGPGVNNRNLAQKTYSSTGSTGADKSDIEKVRNSIFKLDQAMNEKFANLDNILEDKFTYMQHMITNSPMTLRIDAIETRMSNYVQKELFRGLQDQLVDFVTNDTLDIVVKKVTSQDGKFISKFEITERFDEIVKEFDQKLQEKLFIIDFNDAQKDFETEQAEKHAGSSAELAGVTQSVTELRQQLQALEETTKAQAEILATKIDAPKIDELWENFRNYVSFDDLKDLYNKTVPVVAKFEVSQAEFEQELTRQAEMLRRFDEVLSEKAYKAQLQEFRTFCDRKYHQIVPFNQHKQQTAEILKTVQKRQESLSDTLDMLGRQITKDIFSAVKKATAHLKHAQAGTGDGGSGGNVVGVIGEDFRQIVNEKADRKELDDMIQVKANKIDTQLAMRWIELLSRQIKQLAVLVSESLRFEAQKSHLKSFHGESHISYMRGFLLQQGLLTLQWVNKFHTQNADGYFTESFTAAGQEGLNWTPPEILAFEKYAEEQMQQLDMDEIKGRNPVLADNLKLKSKYLAQDSFTPSQKQSTAIVNNRVYYQPGNSKQLNLDTSIMPDKDFLTRTMQSGNVLKGLRANTTLISAISQGNAENEEERGVQPNIFASTLKHFKRERGGSNHNFTTLGPASPFSKPQLETKSSMGVDIYADRAAIKESLLASMISPLKRKGYQPNSRVGLPGIATKLPSQHQML